ncbi:protein ORANGE-LIKE, chloroplastic-like [Miscanthus floridulus]|uniref:protein ORANGE-LIKE, chloroplastic-like n=1 Tax=Miscanthus floridulus TaxID=154761 RepID=UPI003458A84A
MSCLAAPPAAPPTGAPRMLRAAGPLRPPSPCRGLHYYAARGTTTGGGEAGCGRRPQLVLRRCSPAGESRAASGDGGLSSFCIIEGPETIEDFVQMQSQEIEDNIKSRRNKIFLLMEEVRRLRVQQRIRTSESKDANTEENEMPEIPSTIPFMPDASPKTMKQLYMTSFSVISGIIIFGGLVAPVLELKLGLGGTSYEDFIRTLHLPLQLSQVDPIVASFSGGAVGVISALMLVEVRNVRQQEKKRCTYCHGTGYLPCARCSASGMLLNTKHFSLLGHNMWSMKGRCQNCSGAGKVMCPTCLCTGMAMASEHDPRIDPFD